MSKLAEAQKFITDLVLGDFADNPSSMSVVVNGVIGLIPVVDQILDVRDVTAVILQSSKKGWDNLDENDYANIAFASIGCIPEFGSFFKGAVKPLWRNRKTAGRGVQGGVAMLERALGMNKGGVIKWVKAINWAQRTQETVYQAQSALGLYVEMLNAIAANPWWAPIDLVNLARRTLPQAKNAHHEVAYVVRQGSKLIQDFMTDLLGEHAVLVQVAAQMAHANVGSHHHPSGTKVHANAANNANKKRGHADPKNQPDPKKNKLEVDHPEVTGAKKTKANKGTGVVTTLQEKTRKFLSYMDNRPMGLVAEHIVDHHVLKEHQGIHPHGSVSAQSTGPLIKKNRPHRPSELTVEDLSLMFSNGIDSLWKKADGKYLVVETKGRIGVPSTNTANVKSDDKKSKSKIPPLPPAGLNAKQAQLWRLLHDNGDKTKGTSEMQMSRSWVEKDMLETLRVKVYPSSYERRVYLVSEFPTAAAGLNDHLQAIAAAITSGTIEHSHHQSTHGISVMYSDEDIQQVEKLRGKPSTPKPKKSSSTKGTATSSSNQRPTKKY